MKKYVTPEITKIELDDRCILTESNELPEDKLFTAG